MLLLIFHYRKVHARRTLVMGIELGSEDVDRVKQDESIVSCRSCWDEFFSTSVSGLSKGVLRFIETFLLPSLMYDKSKFPQIL